MMKTRRIQQAIIGLAVTVVATAISALDIPPGLTQDFKASARRASGALTAVPDSTTWTTNSAFALIAGASTGATVSVRNAGPTTATTTQVTATVATGGGNTKSGSAAVRLMPVATPPTPLPEDPITVIIVDPVGTPHP